MGGCFTKASPKVDKEISIPQNPSAAPEVHDETSIPSAAPEVHDETSIPQNPSAAPEVHEEISIPQNPSGRGEPTLDWATRLKIAVGSARGLAYLHQDCHPKIIHRDIKSDNILLDLNYEAKIADFGLARIFPDDQTHIEATLAGTFGYLDPEYASSGQLTDKSDVYAFGVILLELVTGHQSKFTTSSSNTISLVHWARNQNYKGIVDQRLQNYSAEELERVVECAAACVRWSRRSRPGMIEVVRVLEGSSSVDCLKKGSTGISRASSSVAYDPGHSVTSSVTRSSTLDPSRLDRGSEPTGSYHSTMSNQDQGGNGTGIPSNPINQLPHVGRALYAAEADRIRNWAESRARFSFTDAMEMYTENTWSQPAVWPAYRQWCNGFNRIISFTTACRYSSFPKSSTFTISPSAGCSWFYCGLLLSLHRASAAPSGCTPAAPAPTWSSRPRTNTSKMLKMATSVGKKLSVERRK
ncbi:hypothetical protein AAC387_Pa03g3501 [Persea americana]